MQSFAKLNTIHMHSRLIVSVLLIFVFTTCAFIFVSSKQTLSATTLSITPSLQSGVAIDGKVNPELIPDVVAYSILFRFLSNHKTEAEKHRALVYLKQSAFNDVEAGGLLIAAAQFQQEVGILDQQVKEIKDRSWPNPGPDVMTQLAGLQQQKEQIVARVVASLQGQLTTNGTAKLQQLTNGRIKTKMKSSPGPQSPPGGGGWQHHRPNHAH